MKKHLLLALLIAVTSGLTLNAQPELYGVAQQGGSGGYGTLFKYDATSGVLDVKNNFNYSNGAYPSGKLLHASNDKFYGTTRQGGSIGYGTIFEYDPDAGTFTTKVNLDYSTGAYSYGHMIQLENDDIIGTSTSGGVYGNGTIWKYDITTNTVTKLKDFDNSTTGAYPYNGVTQASNGKLYGLTWYGGPGGSGTLYELDPLTNVFTVLQSFNYNNGAQAIGKLLEFDGQLYGVTYQGGTYGYGTIFKYDFNASVFTSVYSFNYPSGTYPYVGLNEAGGKLYGTTINGGQNNAGTIYSFDPQTGNVSNFHGFNHNTGSYPYAAVTLASDGNLYGMTQSGNNQGTIYKYDLGSGTYTTLRVLDNSTGIYPFWSQLTDPEMSVPAICRPLKIQKVQTNILCNGLSDGAIDITVTGATSPNYSFLWSNGATTEDVSNLAAGNYWVDVTVNDANGCHKRTFVKITQPAVLSAAASAKKVSFNGTSDGGVNLSVSGGTEPYTYSWSNGATTEDLTGVGVGVYSVDITDANGCLQTASAEVTKRLTAQTDLYGVAQSGGSFGYGTIFKLDYSTNSVEAKHSFNYNVDGATARGKLLYADNGLLYGTTVNGGNQGYGTLYEYDPSTGVLTKKVDFGYSGGLGANPHGQLVQAANGDIYGTCVNGGPYGYGTLWRYDIAANTITVVNNFDYSTTGGHPYGGAVEASNGKLYGLTYIGGSNSVGTLYELDPQTTVFTVKLSFNGSNGRYGISRMVAAGDKLYGTTYQGGIYGYGNIFEYYPATGVLTNLFSFDYNNNGGYAYLGITLASSGLLYGVTLSGAQFGYGSLYSFDPQSGSFNNLHHFNYYAEGVAQNPVMEASDGNIYGLISQGTNTTGAIYSFDPDSNTFAIVQALTFSTGQTPFWTELTELGDVITDPCMADNTAPEVVTKDITVELDADGGVTIATGDIDDGSTDNCTIATYALDISSFDCAKLGPNTVTLTVTDAKGNSASATAIVTVVDTTLPVLTGLFPDIILSACVSTASWAEPEATDNCTVTLARTGPASGSTFENGSTTTITYTATDESGNQATESFVVTRAEALASAASATPILCKGDASTVTVTASGGTAPYSGVGDFQVAAGTHTFTVTDGDGCSTSSTITVNEPGALSASISTSNSYLYYGYTGDQSAVITARPAGGTAPYAVSITMVNGDGAGDTRVLLCNVNGGNESWTSGANTSSDMNACGVKPVSTSNANIGAGGSYSVDVSLMADARFIATITDANGCIYTIPYADGARVDAEDVRCFAGNSGEAKVKICHRTGSSKNPCVAICVPESSLAEHIAHGDYYGSCTASCTAPVANARIAAPAGERGPDQDLVSDAYPNPFNTSLSVAVSNPDHSPVNMHMVDMIGRNLSLKVSTPSEEGVYLLETDHVQPGFYLLRVVIGDKYTRTIKLRKE